MNYLQKIMQAEREFSALHKVKKTRSKDITLCKFQRNKLFYESLKCLAEAEDYRREIDELAEMNFPKHLEEELSEILSFPKH